MAGGQGDDRQSYNHTEIFGAIRDLGRKMDDESRERRGVEAELFREIKDARKDLGGQIDGVKGEVADLTAAVSRLEGERDGERRAAALHPLMAAPPPPEPNKRLTFWQSFGVWAAVAAAVVGVLGGLGQALHTTVSAAVGAYKAMNPQPPSTGR